MCILYVLHGNKTYSLSFIVKMISEGNGVAVVLFSYWYDYHNKYNKYGAKISIGS